MAVKRSQWGNIDTGLKQTHLYTVTNASGATLVLSDYGARVVQMNIPQTSGKTIDVVLGYDSIEDYRRSTFYMGATVGRVANRIRQGRFHLDGKEYRISRNEGKNTLHGGSDGFDRQIWSADFNESENEVCFKWLSTDGDQGFPGNLHVSVIYKLTDDNTVRIEMRASSDQVTHCNLAHHSYFNLAGHDGEAIVHHDLQIDADFYTPVDTENVTTGEVLKVQGTPYDFRKMKAIGAGFNDAELKKGYDHNWCLRGERAMLRPIARIENSYSGLKMQVFTNECGVQLYTGGYLDDLVTGKRGAKYKPFSGFALETQNIPNALNHGHMPLSRLNPDEPYLHIVEFQFSMD